MGAVIDGKAVAQAVRAEVAEKVRRLHAEFGRVPGLATVLVGDDSASHTYVRNKHRACAEVGIESFAHHLPADTPEPAVIALVRELNGLDDVHGILVQLPLPRHIDSQAVIETIDPAKDADGLHPANQARLFQGQPGVRPCTPLGVLRLLDSVGVELEGKRAVVVGRSILVGKPVAILLLERHATVTICHSRTADLAAEIGRAEVLVAAMGQAQLIRGEWIAPGSVVIDVGTNRNAEGRLVGDVDFAGAVERAACITPVPGGVGPMTIAMLLSNTVAAAGAQLARR
jgi:methylenetetrahydrofolate dehydrogenase (NADP+)/methenyltetrahydrofolate cyclohydrolase